MPVLRGNTSVSFRIGSTTVASISRGATQVYLAGDADVARYIAAVEQADGQSLETATKAAFEAFILGCKADGIWSAIKSACIPMGARTVAGAMTPLVGSPTQNFPYASGDYDRKNGLLGDSQKYILFGRSNSADGQDDNHVYANLTSSPASLTTLVGAGSNSTGLSVRVVNFIPTQGVRYRCSTTDWTTALDGGAAAIGGCGVARNSSSEFRAMIRSVAQTYSAASVALYDTSTLAGIKSRIRFASIGAYLNLETLNSRVIALASAISSAF